MLKVAVVQCQRYAMVTQGNAPAYDKIIIVQLYLYAVKLYFILNLKIIISVSPHTTDNFPYFNYFRLTDYNLAAYCQ